MYVLLLITLKPAEQTQKNYQRHLPERTIGVNYPLKFQISSTISHKLKFHPLLIFLANGQSRDMSCCEATL